MRIRFAILYAALALGAGLWLMASGWFDSDQRDLRRGLDRFESSLNKQQGDAERAQAGAFLDLFASDFEFRVIDRGSDERLTDRSALRQAFADYWSSADRIRLIFERTEIDLDLDRGLADTRMDARVRFEYDGPRPRRGRWKLLLRWDRQDDRWRIREGLLQWQDPRRR